MSQPSPQTPEQREAQRQEIRAALGPEACADIDRLMEAFDGRLTYVRLPDGREFGTRPRWPR